MNSIFIDCSIGISGDMIASALFDLGVPKTIFEENLVNLKIHNYFNIFFNAEHSKGIKGIRSSLRTIEEKEFPRSLNDIKEILISSNLNKYVKEKAIKVFEVLAKAEADVHGLNISNVQFHEIGSIDSLIDVVNVCSAIDYLKPHKVYFERPPAGSGIVSTSHGVLPVPVPTVLEIARQNKIPLVCIDELGSGEITTPTGIALIAVFVDKIGQPSSMDIKEIGIGLGHKDISRPNFLRAIMFSDCENQFSNKEENNRPICQLIAFQEAWIDDATPEDIAVLIERLRASGAIEVASQSIDMKKGRKGICIKVISDPKNVFSLREVWFNYSSTLGLRELEINRWVLPRRICKYETTFGKITFKQSKKPNGKMLVKPEHQDLLKISSETGISIEEIRQQVFMELTELDENDDWSY